MIWLRNYRSVCYNDEMAERGESELRLRKIGFFAAAYAVILIFSACQYFPGNENMQTPDNLAEAPNLKPALQETEFFLANYMQQPQTDFELYRKYIEAKGIYITANTAGISERFETRLELCRTTELNTIVIDVKNDDGNITFKNKVALADDLGIAIRYISDIDALLAQLKENDVYTIARVVVFKDDIIWKTYPDYAIKVTDGSNGGIYRQKEKNGYGTVWLNPYNRDVWEYIAELSKQIAELGFDEIQYDYVRFPTDANIKNADFGETGGKSRIEAITEFSQYVCDALKPYNVRLSADIFGTIITSKLDAELIGQDVVELSKIYDIVCPMVYPTHFAMGSFGIQYPDLQPYDTIYGSMTAINERLAEIPQGQHVAIVRPWLQSFSYSGTGHQPYGEKQIREQIQAVYDAGHSEWLLWNAANNYSSDGLLPAE